MSIYQLELDKSELDSLNEVGNRELTVWQGVKNKSLKSRHITDGNLLIDKKHVKSDNKLFDKLCERKSGNDIKNETVKNLIDHLKKEKQWKAKIRGQVKNPAGFGELKIKWIAVVSYKNFQSHSLFPAMKIDMAQKMLGDSADLKIGDSEILTFWRYGVPVAAIASWDFFDVKIKN